MSLFMSTLIVLVILTNISSIYLAKRALTQASEAAVQRGVRNLDLQMYYQSDYNFWQFAWNLTGEGETDPGIPIDCQKGRDDALSAMAKWMQLSESKETANGRENLEDIKVNRVECDGYQLTRFRHYHAGTARTIDGRLRWRLVVFGSLRRPTDVLFCRHSVFLLTDHWQPVGPLRPPASVIVLFVCDVH